MFQILLFIGVITGMIGFAYPLILQVITRLDDKYSSTHVVSLFDREKERNIFMWSFYVALVLAGFWTFHDHNPSIKEGAFHIEVSTNGIIEGTLKAKEVSHNTIGWLLDVSIIIAVVFLVVAFFMMVKRIHVYYTPIKLVEYLFEKHKKYHHEKRKQGKESNLEYFKALSDIFIHSIQKKNRPLSDWLMKNFNEEFDRERMNQEENDWGTVFPDVYHELIYQIIEELIVLKDRKLLQLEKYTSGSIWLLRVGLYREPRISSNTFTHLWKNISLAVEEKRDDLVMHHWILASEYMKYQLEELLEGEWDRKKQDDQINKKQAEERNRRRSYFLQFHYALGGLLLYQKRYDCLRRMFDYTTSEPREYPLLPNSIDDIFDWYMKDREVLFYDEMFVHRNFPFPSMEGVKADGVVGKWVSRYIALLFLRQYTLKTTPHMTTKAPLENLTLPYGKRLLKVWLDGLDFFKDMLSENLEDKELFKALDWSHSDKQWYIDNKRDYPLKYIDNLETLLKDPEKNHVRNVPLDNEKLQSFYGSTKENIEYVYKYFEEISNKSEITENYQSYFFEEIKRKVFERESYLPESTTHYMYRDSILGNWIAKDFYEEIVKSFVSNISESYLIKKADFDLVFARLNIDSEYMIISFGVDFSCDMASDEGELFYRIANKWLEKNGVGKPIKLTSERGLENSILILKKSDLPQIIAYEIDDKYKDYNLKCLDETYHIYASILDLQKTSKDFKKKVGQFDGHMDLDLSVLQSIFLNTEIRWKKNIDMIQIKVYEEYLEGEVPNKVNDVLPLKKLKPKYETSYSIHNAFMDEEIVQKQVFDDINEDVQPIVSD
ncbi:hypothetical protein [Sediminitomix flava]|uniref:Uncharacterized protein n=1 Tax=Sediminitomix flava TaxID=379075 RepID=A0A315ZBY2_SEDFL|nr:hypothetical protein [Sediminitomix flava]PWJ42669.1 hypothetical protein BC781_102214 [Sediminitomix flava]